MVLAKGAKFSYVALKMSETEYVFFNSISCLGREVLLPSSANKQGPQMCRDIHSLVRVEPLCTCVEYYDLPEERL